MFTKILEYQKYIMGEKNNLSEREKKAIDKQMLVPFKKV